MPILRALVQTCTCFLGHLRGRARLWQGFGYAGESLEKALSVSYPEDLGFSCVQMKKIDGAVQDRKIVHKFHLKA